MGMQDFIFRMKAVVEQGLRIVASVDLRDVDIRLRSDKPCVFDAIYIVKT